MPPRSMGPQAIGRTAARPPPPPMPRLLGAQALALLRRAGSALEWLDLWPNVQQLAPTLSGPGRATCPVLVELLGACDAASLRTLACWWLHALVHNEAIQHAPGWPGRNEEKGVMATDTNG